MTTIEIILGTVLVFITSNAIGVIYSCLVLYTGLFKRYRIQHKPYVKGVLSKRLPLYVLNIFLVLALTVPSLLFLEDYIDTTWPSLWLFIGQLFFILIIDDVWFYFSHRWMHRNKWALKNIHSIHHRATTPFPIEYLYVHPLEWMLGMVGIMIGVALVFIVMPVNIYVFWVMGFIRNMHEIHIHSDLKIPLLNWIPFVSSTEKHDLHHSKLNGNYASMFSVWDKIMKTEFKDSQDD
ncbi:MAG: sterol desaturase/sphingolipid hydroxylase (fatty acid hydroxylase superfamily) [Crocinitomicaceae bacterium]|jgi:sterol desaturase/sphingolipid hydroxylase (fatty acid hydroxylase superfamily)